MIWPRARCIDLEWPCTGQQEFFFLHSLIIFISSREFSYFFKNALVDTWLSSPWKRPTYIHVIRRCLQWSWFSLLSMHKGSSMGLYARVYGGRIQKKRSEWICHILREIVHLFLEWDGKTFFFLFFIIMFYLPIKKKNLCSLFFIRSYHLRHRKIKKSRSSTWAVTLIWPKI